MKNLMTSAEYLAHCYELPKKFPELPLADEKFITLWSEKENFDVLRFLSQELELPTGKFDWKKVAAMKIEIKETLGGRLPVISTANHDDFCKMAAFGRFSGNISSSGRIFRRSGGNDAKSG